MYFYQDPQFGERMITLMAALVLVLQIAMVAQRWLVTNIRVFAVQSFLLAGIATTIAYFNNAPHIYFVAAITIVIKVIFLPVLMERLVVKIELRQEIKPLINIPLSVLISGALTILGYVVAESFYHPGAGTTAATLGLVLAVKRKKGLHVVVVEANAVVDDGETDDVAFGVRAATLRCLVKGNV